MSFKFLFVSNAMIVIHRNPFIMEYNSNRSCYFDISNTRIPSVPYDLVDNLSGNEVNESLFGRRCI